MSIDEIMERLEHGDVLMIDDMVRTYISMESSDTPNRFVARSVYASVEDAAIRENMRTMVNYEERRFGSLVEALLSLTDWEWRSKIEE